ncbi:hypothetical protein [Nocardia sp. NPDC049149]|uniref:hypothetical protein n=1 Tax=Nocardia sp. NPDC049149 TaxID=3364315 RepID=UPI00371FDA37
MSFFVVEPEVAGELGPGTEYDRSAQPAVVTKLEYRFSDWLGDAIVESVPCFIATEDLARAISESSLTGVSFADVTVTISPEAEMLMTDELPKWRWMQFSGSPYESDFGLSGDLSLIVSERALAVLRHAGISNADYYEAGNS